VRFEDKTEEEVAKEKRIRSRQRIEKMMRIRTYQFGGLGVVAFFYFFVYRKFLAPRPVMNSVVYHQAISFIKQNQKCQSVLGKDFQIMLCNGKMWPFKNDIKFDLVAYGSKTKGKLQVESFYDKGVRQYKLDGINLKTLQEEVKII